MEHFKRSGPAWGWRWRVTLTGVIAGGGLVAAGCGGSSPSASSTTTTAAGGGATTTAAPSQANELQALQTAVQSAHGATFKATYTGSGTSSSSSTVTFEQKPPKSLFQSGDGLIINNGTTTYYCSGSSGHQNCVTMAGNANPMAGLMQLYSGSAAVGLFQQWQTQVAARAAGVNVSFTNQTFAGQSAKCVNWSYQGQSAKYCITGAGILAYAGGTGVSSGGSLELTAYSTDVADADFNPPAGATVQTTP